MTYWSSWPEADARYLSCDGWIVLLQVSWLNKVHHLIRSVGRLEEVLVSTTTSAVMASLPGISIATL